MKQRRCIVRSRWNWCISEQIIIGNIWKLSGKTNKQRDCLKSYSLLIASYCLNEAGKQNYCEQKMVDSVQIINKNNKHKKAVVPVHSENGFLWIAALEYLVWLIHSLRRCSRSSLYISDYVLKAKHLTYM